MVSILKLNQAQIDYLLRHFDVPEAVTNTLHGIRSVKEFAQCDRAALLEQIANRLQQAGFDAEYDLTEEGRMLESLIDFFGNRPS